MNFKALFEPRTIAVVGANESSGFGGAVCRNLCQSIDDPDCIYFINPRRDTLMGKPCYARFADLPEPIDMAVIATNKRTVIPLLKEGKEKCLKAAVIFASGFSETGLPEDIALENELAATAAELDITILGPNCAGFSNFPGGINAFAFLSEKRDRKGHIGFISQSGMIALSMIDNQNTRFSCSISCGNASSVGMPDLIRFLADDPETHVIGLYMDGIRDLTEFESAVLYAKQQGKRMAVLKAGSTPITRLLIRNHTGSEEHFSDDQFTALLDRAGIIRCGDLEEMIYTLCALDACPVLPKGNRLAAITLSGGEAVLLGEGAAEFSFSFPPFTEDLNGYLTQRLPSYAHVSNPLDMTAILSYDTERLADALIHVMRQPQIDAVLFGYTLLLQIDDPCIFHLIDALKIVHETLGNQTKPLFLVSFMSNTRNQDALDQLRSLGVLCLPTPYYAFRVLTGLLKAGQAT